MDRKLLETAFDAGWWAAKSENIYSQDQEREEFLADLHTQPQASEDAQPVAWRCSREWTSDGLGKWQYHDGPPNPSHLARNVQALFLHPAPDALRVAVEKVRDQYKNQMRFCDIEPLPYFREFVQRLDAALQAEQGAK